MTQITHIGVIGSGTMGQGIIQTCANFGYSVSFFDQTPELMEAAVTKIGSQLDRLVVKGKIDEERRGAIIGNIHQSSGMDGFAECEFVIEAVFEDEQVKRDLFAQLDKICGPDTVFASNTSSISVTRLGAATQRPESMIGMHFMNPVPIMKLVEIIRSAATNDATFRITRDLALALGKTPVEVRDYPGFISNRVLMPMINEAIFCLYERVASAEDIDQVLKLGMNHPMGPLTLADFIGLDVCLSIMQVLYDGFRDSKYRPCPLLKQMVDAGWLGRKTGKGFYQYD